MQPTPDELREWARNAKQRNACLPETIQIAGRYVSIICGNCGMLFKRRMLPGRDDPVFVCPSCGIRNYVPVEW